MPTTKKFWNQPTVRLLDRANDIKSGTFSSGAEAAVLCPGTVLTAPNYALPASIYCTSQNTTNAIVFDCAALGTFGGNLYLSPGANSTTALAVCS